MAQRGRVLTVVTAGAVGVVLTGGMLASQPAAGGPQQQAGLRYRGGSFAIDILKRLTDDTGGWTYPVASAKRCKEVCLRVAEELRNQYVFGYYPTNREKDGRWRTMSVRTRRPGVTLFTRSGYYAPTP